MEAWNLQQSSRQMDQTLDSSIDQLQSQRGMNESEIQLIRTAILEAVMSAYKRGLPGRASMEYLIEKVGYKFIQLAAQKHPQLLQFAQKEELEKASRPQPKEEREKKEAVVPNDDGDDVIPHVFGEEQAGLGEPNKPIPQEEAIQQKPYEQENESTQKLALDANRSAGFANISSQLSKNLGGIREEIKAKDQQPSFTFRKYPPLPQKPNKTGLKMEVIKQQKEQYEDGIEPQDPQSLDSKLRLKLGDGGSKPKREEQPLIESELALLRSSANVVKMSEFSPTLEKNEASPLVKASNTDLSGLDIFDGEQYLSPINNSSESSPSSFEYKRNKLSGEGPNPILKMRERAKKNKALSLSLSSIENSKEQIIPHQPSKNEGFIQIKTGKEILVNQPDFEEQPVSSQSQYQLRQFSFKQEQKKGQQVKEKIKEEPHVPSIHSGNSEFSSLDYSNSIMPPSSSNPQPNQEVIVESQDVSCGVIDAVAKPSYLPENIFLLKSRLERYPSNPTSQHSKGISERLFKSTSLIKREEQAPEIVTVPCSKNETETKEVQHSEAEGHDQF